jgi:uridine phosphorylase
MKRKNHRNWYEADDDSRLIISPCNYISARGLEETARIPQRLVVFETSAAIPHIIQTYDVQESQKMPGFLGDTSVYMLKGHSDIAFIQGACGAPGAVCNLESAIAMGCKALFVFGQCGGVAHEVSVGDIIVPTEVEREEGTSFHYTSDERSALPDDVLLNDLKDYLARRNDLSTPVHIGKTVTTDAVFRQTLRKELCWRAEGVLGVEMELSALLTVARYHRIPAVGLLVVSDKHDLDGETQWRWGASEFGAKRLKAIDVLIDFARKARSDKSIDWTSGP